MHIFEDFARFQVAFKRSQWPEAGYAEFFAYLKLKAR